MYGRMQLADYVVSYALKLLSDSLHRLAVAEETPAPRDCQVLARNTGRLLSVWQLMHWSVGKATYRDGVARLRECARALPPDPRWVEGAVAQLVAVAPGAKAKRAVSAARDVVLAAPPEQGGGFDRERFGSLLQEESQVWRDDALLRRVRDADLIEHGLLRAHSKAARLCRRLEQAPTSRKLLCRSLRWVGHGVNHLELLRPGLSETNRARAWFLDRLAANIRKQLDVERFLGAGAPGLKPKARARLERLVAERRRRIVSQRAKLVAGAFQGDVATFGEVLQHDVENLGLHEIVLLPVEAVRNDAG